MADVDVREVKEFLSKHAHLELIEDNQSRKKVKCKLTGHELPCRMSELQTYIKGKKYQRLLKNMNQTEPGWHKYQEFLVPNKKSKKHDQLFCKLTKKSINNMPHHIERHVNGKKFQRALVKYEKSLDGEENSEEANMWVPSDLESDGGGDDEMITDGESESKSESLEPKEEIVENGNSYSEEERVQDASEVSTRHKRKNSKSSAKSVKRRLKEREEKDSSPKKKRKTEHKNVQHNSSKREKKPSSVKQKLKSKHKKDFSKKPKLIKMKTRD